MTNYLVIAHPILAHAAHASQMRVYLRKGKGEQRIAKIFTGTCASSLRNKHTYTTDRSKYYVYCPHHTLSFTA